MAPVNQTPILLTSVGQLSHLSSPIPKGALKAAAIDYPVENSLHGANNGCHDA